MMAVGLALVLFGVALVYIFEGAPAKGRFCWRHAVTIGMVVGVLLMLASVVKWLWQVMP